MRSVTLAIVITVVGCTDLCCSQVSIDGAEPTGALSTDTPAFGEGTVGKSCQPSQDGCQWRISECSANPDCARWYECLLRCPVGTLDSCSQICDDKFPWGDDDRTPLRTCLLTASGCPSSASGDSSNKKAMPAGMAGSGGSEVGFYDGAAGLEQPGDSGVIDPGSGFSSCHDCVYTGCMAEFCQLDGDRSCGVYKGVFISCSPDERSEQTEVQQRACLLQKETGADSVAAKKAHELFASSGTLQCIMTECIDLCVPKEQRPCQTCLKSACREELVGYSRSAVAQDSQWCQSGCAAQSEVPTQQCLEEKCSQYAEGNPTLELLIACRYLNCPDACEGTP